MTWYDFWKFLHVGFAVLWVGGGAMIQFFALRTLRAHDNKRTVEFAGDVEWIGSRLLTTFSAGAFLTGIGLVWNAPFWKIGDDWIVIGLVLFAVTFLAGAAFFGPEAGRISRLAAAEGPNSPVVQARIRRILVLSRIDLVVLFLILFDMAVKPSFDDGWTIVGALVIAAVVAAVLVVPASRSNTVAAPAE
ncbi:MAG TPA: DUF2269 family protein [Gaiellaceae bacterium]|nr:DUF2269 family protein [Gaiellaceae bacterium]